MGITTPISTNPAMTIGGLKTGVTPLDMAHAYETIAHGGERVSGTLAEPGAPVGIEAVQDGSHEQVDRTRLHRVLPEGIATTETEMLETVLEYGTARSAALGQFAAGKTGTTSNYGDAWFVGWDHRYTVAVWVGFPNSLVPMLTEFDGGPVLGGTFPALIWHNFMVSAMQVEQRTRRRRSGQASGRRRQEDARGDRCGPGRGRGSQRDAPRTPPLPPPRRNHPPVRAQLRRATPAKRRRPRAVGRATQRGAQKAPKARRHPRQRGRAGAARVGTQAGTGRAGTPTVRRPRKRPRRVGRAGRPARRRPPRKPPRRK